MKNETIFFEFNAARIPVVVRDNALYVPITPICEFLGVDCQEQVNFLRQNDLCTDRIYTLIVDDVPRTGGFKAMVCLPMMLAVGWIPNIKSNRAGFNQELIAFLKAFFTFTKQLEQNQPSYLWN